MPTALHHSMMTVTDLLSLKPEGNLPKTALRRLCLSLVCHWIGYPANSYSSQPHLCLSLYNITYIPCCQQFFKYL